MPIVRTMKAVYTDSKFIPNEEAVNVWYELLKDLDAKVVMASVAEYMQTEKFPPFPADLRKATEAKFLSPDEAWGLVSNCLWSVTSRERARKEFDKLPIECQKTIGSADALYTYTQGEWNEGVNKALFVKAYKPTVETLKNDSRMSLPLRTALGRAERKKIEERNQS